MLIVLLAGTAMLLQDILAVLLVQAESRSKGLRAGILDALMWLCALWSNHYALDALNNHHHVGHAVVIIVVITSANILGCISGTRIGKRYFPDPNEGALAALEARVAELEARCSQ